MACNQTNRSSKWAPISGVFIGLVGGFMLALFAIPMGIVFAPIGLFLLGAALLMPILGVFTRKAKCPCCQRTIYFTCWKHSIKCGDCKRRIVMRGRGVHLA